ncbi:monosaccharide ABC transporter ATP-binding protein, CUT2 family [Oscillibacter sp. PC13]|uniref:sugar ABC transporter ATP-binding protein n=1 Tax=Oscillibacter sp. PC13 TaxID=1855299 RepID=UPI0008EAA09E|nr:sugar ABC transporter ATP-binding protein [Oscillibacter sp. PC13]SFP65471.1 monosaccharide ABC transporter ATP-binding protein, CUT2 family [Oscillibacter sp. PC13]
MNALELKGISKSFGRNQVLFGVDFALRPGEIHAIMGENGAGKSTLMNIVYGNLKPDGGEIYINGQKTAINHVLDAQNLGICFVHQEIALCQDATVAENIFMSQIGRGGKYNLKTLAAKAKEILDPLSSKPIDPYEIVERLPISSQQVVEIAKAISNNCRILILDEPTSSLSGAEAEALHQMIHRLRENGIGIIYISHRMSDIFEQCDRVSVLRDGHMVATYNVSEVSVQQLVNDMAGREVDMLYPEKAADLHREESNVVLDVRGLEDAAGKFHEINFRLYQGEVLGFAGLLGAGRSEIMKGIVGLRKLKGGEVLFQGKNIVGMRTKDIFDSGLVMLPEDRKKQGLFLDMNIRQNTVATYLSEITKNGIIDRKKERELTQSRIERMNIRCVGSDQIVRSLSGGNQQKVLVAKTLAKKPEIVIMDEPTRGVDVGAKAEIHRLLRDLTHEGVSVILVSSELNEVIGMCDRVELIDGSGTIVKEVLGDEINSDTIMYYISDAYRYEQSNREVSINE